MAHLGGPELFGQLLWAEAKRRGWEGAKDQAVDWYHALEHLADAAKLLYGENTPAAKKWYKLTEKLLYQGHAQQIAEALHKQAVNYSEEVAEKLHKQAAYLDTHKRRMQYLELREDGYLIGSGMVESGCKQFKSRFCGPGMRWNRTGIERLIPIRAATMSACFDTAWSKAYNSASSRIHMPVAA